jgi:hypothetical protein
VFYQTESKPKCWRAVASLETHRDRLLCLGYSASHVQAEYVPAFMEVLSDEEREQVRAISLQRWQEIPGEGKWLHFADLDIPETITPRRAA